jgi:anaerobic selenocysteine-containing dehydrogenase
MNIPHLRREVAGETPAVPVETNFEHFESVLKEIYKDYTFDFAAQESGVDAKIIEEIAKLIATAGTRFSSHNWRSVSSGVSGGWAVARAVFMLNALLGAVASLCRSQSTRLHTRRCGTKHSGRANIRWRCMRCLSSCPTF